MMRPTHLRHLRERGLTLVELMISVVLSLLIVLALMTLLINVNRNNTELTRTNSVIENGRFSLQLLEADISHGGFWGGYVPTFDDLNITASIGTTNNGSQIAFPTGTQPDPCLAFASWDVDYKAKLIAIPLQVYQIPTSGTSPVCTGVITNAQPSTDVLVVRHAAPCPATATATDSDCRDVAGNVFFQFSRCASDTSSWVLSATTGELVLRDGKCSTTPATKYRFVSTLYWIRNYFSTVGDGIPTLVRSRFQLSGSTLAHANTEALIEGVEGFRVQLGVDNLTKPLVSGGTGSTLASGSFTAAVSWSGTANLYTPTNRGDGNADTYITCSDASAPCSNVFNLANTVAARVHVLARASTATPGHTDTKSYTVGGTTMGPFNNGFKRKVYSQAIRLVNVSMRREVPNAW